MPESLDLDAEIITISELNQLAREVLEAKLSLVWVEGEISNLARPRSGHLYFSLKDNDAQVRCAMFRHKNQYLEFEPEDGMQVLARARVSLYEPCGDFQLIVESLEETGFGALQQTFEKLKQKLAKEGLFAMALKKPIPSLPKQIGVITSPTGAAIRDVLIVLKRRFANIPVILYPTLVQGDQAAEQIAHAIEIANLSQECDVLLLVRGGGSLEDLWSFNEEIVAKAIFTSEIPIISGVGHEVDVTISDFIADQRAATPSAAAELASPNHDDWLKHIDQLTVRMLQHVTLALNHIQTKIDHLQQRLVHPGRKLIQQMQMLDELEKKLNLALQHFHRHQQSAVKHFQARLLQHDPQILIRAQLKQNEHLIKRFALAIQHALSKQQAVLGKLSSHLDTISPLQTISRGYAILTSDQQILRSVDEVEIGAKINARLIDGLLVCQVEEKK